MRQLISNAINASEDMQVIGLARNGKEAVTKTRELRPDVITLDVDMPVLSGLEALAQIMRETPTPVVMVSSLTVEGARETLEALEMGAVDVISKPQRRADIDQLAAAIAPRLRSAATAHLSAGGVVAVKPKTVSKTPPSSFELVVVGCSTGGPAALQRIIPELPEDFPAPIVVAQHIPVGFTGPMAHRLDQCSKIKVVEAVHGAELEPSTVYIAPAGSHTVVRKHESRMIIEILLPEAALGLYRPSVNALFLSAEAFAPHVLAVVLTGMGQDGLEGVKALHAKGAHIVAESEESAVIYGMPRVIVESKLAHRVLNLEQIVEFLSTSVKK
ncbi:MAG: chemotaxis-specific protein-glutamate methyltransferase CheB [Peptococcaceae bacterium]|nr:chemotaxis-specific protein-glutamate methyltransferase CheB [Peptococcaceae bacterium]